jgi:hypothetical protein
MILGREKKWFFFLDFISENVNGDEHFWSSQSATPIHIGWQVVLLSVCAYNILLS